MKRLSRPGRYANVTATMALVVALGGSSYAAVSLPRNSVDSEQIRKDAITSDKVKDHSLLSSDFKVGQLASGSAKPAAAGAVNRDATTASAALALTTTLVSFSDDFPSVPPHGCIFRLVSYPGSAWYQMPIWLDNYLPPGLVVTNLQGQSYGASMSICNLTDGALDPTQRSYSLLLVNRFD